MTSRRIPFLWRFRRSKVALAAAEAVLADPGASPRELLIAATRVLSIIRRKP